MADKISFDEEAIEDKIRELVNKMRSLDRAHVQYQKDVRSLTQERQVLREEIAVLAKKKKELESESVAIIETANSRAGALSHSIIKDAKAKAEAIVDDANKIKTETLYRNEAASKILDEAMAKMESAEKKEKEIEIQRGLIIDEWKGVDAKGAELESDRVELDSARSYFNAEAERRERELRNREEELRDRASNIDAHARAIAESSAELDKKRQEISVLHSELVILENRIDGKKKNLATLEARETAVAKRDAEADKKLRKAEFELNLAHKKEQDAAILNLQARRTFETIQKKEAVLAKLNIPVK